MSDHSSESGLHRAPLHQSVVRKPLFGGVEFEMMASEGLFALCFFLALRDFMSAILLSVVVLTPLHMAMAAMQRRQPNLVWYALRLALSPQVYAPSPDVDSPAPSKPTSVS
jgi:type IV secretory pathway TrbD component